MAAVSIRLSPALRRQLDQLSRELGRTRSEIVRDALRRQLATCEVTIRRKRARVICKPLELTTVLESKL